MERLDDMGTRILARVAWKNWNGRDSRFQMVHWLSSSPFLTSLSAWYKVGQDNPDYPKPNFNSFNLTDPETNSNVEATGNHNVIIREVGAASTVLLKNKNSALPLNKPKKIAIIGEGAAPAQGGPNRFGDRGGNDDGNDGTLGVGWGSGEWAELNKENTSIADCG